MAEPARYISTPTSYLMVLRQGDEVIERLGRLTREEAIPSASVTGFGFVATARFGFDPESGDDRPGEFHALEITGLTGTLAWADGQPSVHAHAAGGDRAFNLVGGHVLALTVGRGAFELTVTVHPRALERRRDEAIGANILQLR